MSFITSIALYFVASFCGAWLVTWLVLRHVRIMDVPNARSSHTTPTPRGGGLGIVVGFFLSLALIAFWAEPAFAFALALRTPAYAGFFAALLLIAAIAFHDDIAARGFASKLVVQLAAVVMVMLCGITITALPLWLALPLTLLWILGLTNAYNFMDGLDGMAGGTAAIAAGFFALICAQHTLPLIALLSLSLCAGASAFLCFNWPPARIFMGDIGSTFLGFAFATLALLAGQDQPLLLLTMPLLMLHFLFDTIYTFLRRLRAGEKITQAHRSHLYQLLNRSGYAHRKLSLIYAGLALLQGLAALWLSHAENFNARLWIVLPFLIAYTVLARHITRQARQRGLL